MHTAWHAGLPILITAGIPPVAYPGSMRGARDPEGHLWLQQTFDQNGIVRQYTKWDHHLEFQDNPGLMVSRALQVACSEPCGPVYLSIPREVSLAQVKSARFPTLPQLGVARPSAPDPAGVRELATRLVRAENPVVVVARSGRNPATVAALVRFAELLGLPVAQSAKRAYHCFPLTHPLYQSGMSLKDSDWECDSLHGAVRTETQRAARTEASDANTLRTSDWDMPNWREIVDGLIPALNAARMALTCPRVNETVAASPCLLLSIREDCFGTGSSA